MIRTVWYIIVALLLGVFNIGLGVYNAWVDNLVYAVIQFGIGAYGLLLAMILGLGIADSSPE